MPKQLLRLDAMQAEGQSVAHIGAVEPVDDRNERAGMWPSSIPWQERRYLCGRPTRSVHKLTFAWNERDEFPTCKRCAATAGEMLTNGDALAYGRERVVIHDDEA